jgi:hypothetical protein
MRLHKKMLEDGKGNGGKAFHHLGASPANNEETSFSPTP